MKAGKLWDIFCRVIDNYGDIGVCWRLAAGLAARGERVRLWLDDASALGWMAPEGAAGVEVRPWTDPLPLEGLIPGDVLLEAFGCEVAPEFIAAYKSRMLATRQKPRWINLEYLSAESFAERCHGLPSPVMSGPGAGLGKRFFYPGFSAATGGLLREPDLLARQSRFERSAWLRRHGIECQDRQLISLFCYEPDPLGELLLGLARGPRASALLVTTGRAAAAVRACVAGHNASNPGWNQAGTLSFFFLPALSQRDYDGLLWACDLNFVRGEDSLVRALWANKPFVWQIYPQHDAAHHPKLDAFLQVMNAPASWRTFHHVWNAVPGLPPSALPQLALPEWQETLTQARDRLLQQDDLVTQIMLFE